MVSVVLVLVAREDSNFWALSSILNVTEDKTQIPRNIIENNNMRKFRYDDYLAIFRFKLLSYVIEVDAYFSEHCGFFCLRWVGLEGPSPHNQTLIVKIQPIQVSLMSKQS